jgi:hypothetical protein
MTVARWFLVLVAVFVTGVAVGMLCAPPTEKVADADRDCDRDYERLQKSYWWALHLKERREDELIDMSLKTGIPWGKPREESHE